MKVILISLFVSISLVANAQFMRGDKFIGGTFSVGVQRSTGENNWESKFNSCSASPTVGFFLNEKYAIGGGIGYATNRYKSEQDPDYYQENRTNSIGASAFLARYFMISDQFYFKLTGALSYGRQHETQDNGSAESKVKKYSVDLSLRPSLIFFPSANWGIEGGIGNLSAGYWRSLSDETKGTSVGLDYGSIYFGFAYYFRGAAE